MPNLDRSSGRLVVRIAYDGPPVAGKTASLRALGVDMGAPVTSFDEAYGRTLWFDWMQYRGGLYGGLPIDCEVAALPGQTALASRRNQLLVDVDVVVFVADASPEGRAATLHAFERLQRTLAVRPRVAPVADSDVDLRPGLVVQANKQDVTGALPADAMRKALLLDHHIPVVETVAADSIGIRHAFVLAVREAVRRADRVRRWHGELPEGTTRSARDLLASMQAPEHLDKGAS